nr:hypothetical protein Iba_chr02cCG2700 [Ipomoea batatas]
MLDVRSGTLHAYLAAAIRLSSIGGNLRHVFDEYDEHGFGFFGSMIGEKDKGRGLLFDSDKHQKPSTSKGEKVKKYSVSGPRRPERNCEHRILDVCTLYTVQTEMKLERDGSSSYWAYLGTAGWAYGLQLQFYFGELAL